MKPSVTFRIPRLTGTAQDSQGSKLFILQRIEPRSHQQTDGGRTDTQMADLMAINHFPQPIGARIIGCTFTNQERGPVEPTADDLPWTHHPADISEPPEEIIFSTNIKIESQLFTHLSHAACVSMNGSLRLSGRSAGVDHQAGIHRPHHLGRSVPFITLRDLMPPDVSPRLH